MQIAEKSHTRYNVVLITIDSLRADYLGCYNPDIHREGISPNIDQWVNNAILFENAITQSSHTSPAFLAMMSGDYPSKYGDWFSMISDGRTMISEIFKRNGYSTYAFNSNPYISNFYGFDRGYDVFVDNMPALKKGNVVKNVLRLNKLKTLFTEPYETAQIINSQAIRQMGNMSTPYFLWVHYMDVHGPYIPKKGWAFKNRILADILWSKALRKPEQISAGEKESLVEAYKDEMKYLDHHVMELLRHVDRDNTIIIMIADHGDLFGEHNLYGHTLKLYQGLLHIPLVMKIPRDFNCNISRIQTQVRSIDIVPTLVDMLHLKAGNDFDGKSFFSLMSGDKTEPHCDYVLSEVSRKHLCVQKDGWKLIVNYKNNHKELYHLSVDPKEETNRIGDNKGIADALEMIIQEHLNKNTSSDGAPPPIGVTADEGVKERLRALGYFD